VFLIYFFYFKKRGGRLKRMNAVEKALKKQLIGGILLSCMFAGGIPMIILGAVYSVLPVMIPGIAFTVAGFYGAPLVWVNYGNKLRLKRIVYAVEKEHLLTVQSIASQLSKSEKSVRGLLDECFRRGYLEGYIRQGDGIALNEAKAPEEKRHAAECKYCGAKFSYQGELAVCPYCGAVKERDGA
jgi:hypothetical protein